MFEDGRPSRMDTGMRHCVCDIVVIQSIGLLVNN